MRVRDRLRHRARGPRCRSLRLRRSQPGQRPLFEDAATVRCDELEPTGPRCGFGRNEREVVSAFGTSDPSCHRDRMSACSLERKHQFAARGTPGDGPKTVTPVGAGHDRARGTRLQVAHEQTGRPVQFDTRRERQRHLATLGIGRDLAGDRLRSGHGEQRLRSGLPRCPVSTELRHESGANRGHSM